jgi:hypothetical protein
VLPLLSPLTPAINDQLGMLSFDLPDGVEECVQIVATRPE